MSAFNEETYGYLVTNNDYIAVDEEEESKTGYERELFAFFDAMTVSRKGFFGCAMMKRDPQYLYFRLKNHLVPGSRFRSFQ